MGITIYLLTFLLLLVAVYGIVAKKNIVKIIVSLAILDYALNLLLVLVGYRTGGKAPILSPGQSTEQFVSSAVDPLPQAMVLTSIVIGLSIMALMVAMALRLHEKYGTFDMEHIRRLKG
ncbi:MAG: NADH-quinone oxidoreductase subunit K [Planctomycetes bacterium]|nr:NADH-quinone oxidoreductase subunit K [Planctomycetota bacterium]